MNSKLIAAAVGGAGLGALYAWAITADHYAQKLNSSKQVNSTLRRMLTREIEARQELETIFQNAAEAVANDPSAALETRVAEDGTMMTTEIQGEKPRGDETSEPDEADENDVAPDEPIEETRRNLKALIDQYAANPEDRDGFVEKAIIEEAEPKARPFVISREDFSWDEEGEEYVKITLTYYPRARVLMEDDDVVDEPGQVVGWKNLDQFGGESGDPDTVFIRNRKLRTDFEVVRELDSPLPLHVKYGLGKEEFNVAKAAGTLRLRDEDLEQP